MREAALPAREDRRIHVLLRADALAATGECDDCLNIIRLLVSEGYPEAAAWLNQIAVREKPAGFCL